ncbi:hypothetical protein DPMN_035059 [Dreissena polymorpha]|uniref:Uncharacterized protein n=1 Tax=Dreissena polymorpha TaxID=45954 RepID=A0A9D4M9R2_DREPO|nr:hypothetical protein DPMN_035009 [Dreissena polymorpha]KAH3871844.1 hypothetical protein DPMN_035059 [Dreissena polymorpha]
MSLVILRTFCRLKACKQTSVTCYTRRFASRKNDSTALDERRTSSPSDVAQQPPYQFMTEFYNNPEKFSYEKTFPDPQADSWKFEKPICLTCITVLFVYFGFIREENNLDKILKRPLYDTFPYLEQQNLEDIISTLQGEGKDTTEYEEELLKVQKKAAAMKK